LVLVAWAAAANASVEQKTVLSGKVLSNDLVTPGNVVKEGDILVVVDSITGPIPAVRATTNGKVSEVLIKPGDNVQTGDVLVKIEPSRK
jgi:biotin carboxyl carrier protein